MDWARILAYITGIVDQELLLRNEYLAAENVSAHESTPINSRNNPSILSPVTNTGERHAPQSRIQSPGQLLAATT